jgi:hypothetical protein
MAQSLELEDFSGGVTDYYLNAPPNKLKSCDNLLINVYPQMGKPFTRPGSRLFDASHPQIPAGAQRINTCFFYKNVLYVQSAQKIYFYHSIAGWTEVQGPTGNNAFPLTTTAHYFNYAHWNYHTLFSNSNFMYPKKLVSGVSAPFLVEAGLPKFITTGMAYTHGGGTHSNWLYKFVYRYDYATTGNVLFSDVGSPSDSFAVDGHLDVEFSDIPVLANTIETNFDVTNIKIDIYRTVNNGTVFYKIATINNGQTTYKDNTPDSTPTTDITTNEVLYTTGGVVANDRPPRCLTVHVKNDTAYYGNVIYGSEHINFRFMQSIPGDIDSVPESFYGDIDDEIICISSTKSNVVLLCRNNSVYRVDGEYDALGRGGTLTERISDTANCISPQCAVQALDGVFWLGTDGAYFTDGFRVQKLNTDYDKTYKSFITNNSGQVLDSRNFKVQGKYDKKKNRVWWTFQRNDSLDTDFCYILDLNWGISDKCTFTTASGTSFYPTAIEFYNGELIRCDSRGYVLLHQDNLFVDPKIDITRPPASWYDETIIYQMETIAFNFGTSATRKYVTKVNVSCETTTNLGLQIISNNDDNKKIGDLSPIRYRGNILWGDPDVYWGDLSLEWNKQGLLHETRRMPAQSLRCNFKSIKLTNAKVAIISSDLIGTASINANAKTVTLTNTTTYDWPSRSVGYFIAFEYDNFTKEYEIILRTGDVLIYNDFYSTSQSGTNQKWILRGYAKGEVLNLLNMSIIYEMSGPTLNPFRSSESGEVGT